MGSDGFRSLLMAPDAQVRFSLASVCDLLLALLFATLPTATLGAPLVCPLLLLWVGAGLAWEVRELLAELLNASDRA